MNSSYNSGHLRPEIEESMPKVIQMPRRTQPEKKDQTIHRPMILPEVFEESESLGKIQRWLEAAGTVLNAPSTNKKRTA